MHNQKLRIARTRKHWTIEKAAEKVGVSWLTYSRWENGTQKPHPTTLALLCQAFDMSCEDLGFAPPVEQSQEEARDGLALSGVQLDQNPLITLTKEQIRVLSFLIGDDTMGHFDPSRRAMLQQLLTAIGLAKLSPHILANQEPWERLASAATKPSSIDEGTLHHFEELTRVCWHLTNGTELAIIEQVLPTYHPKLVKVAQQHSKYK